MPDTHTEKPHTETTHAEKPHTEKPYTETTHAEKPHTEKPHTETTHAEKSEKQHAEQPILTVSRLSKSFTVRSRYETSEIQAVKDASFSIPRGTTFGLVGESGSGKTTTARMLLGLEYPDSGTIQYHSRTERSSAAAEKNMQKNRKRKLTHSMQMVFQDAHSSFNPKMTMRQSLLEGLWNRNIRGIQAEYRVRRLAELVGISPDRLDAYPHQFSGGQKQRLSIARALSMEPELLILDEPVSSLDVSIQAQIINLLLDLKKELSLTYLFISHDLGLVGYMSDCIAVMYQGEIVENGWWDDILHRPRHPYTKKLFSAALQDALV